MYVIETVFPVERPGYYEHLVQRRDKADIQSACIKVLCDITNKSLIFLVLRLISNKTISKNLKR